MSGKPKTAAAFDLETTLPYLLNRAGVRIGLSFSERIAKHSLSLPEWRILGSLLGRDGQSVSELAEHTSAELSRASRLVADLTRRKLLRRDPHDTDGRAWAISLTAEGRALAKELALIAQFYERIALAGMKESEIADLKRLLALVYDNIRAVDEGDAH